MSFWEQAKQRNVIKVAAAYAIVAWLLVQIVALVETPLRLPDWTDSLVIVLLAVGFVVAVFLAWAYELTPQGIKRTKTVPLADSARRATSLWLNYAVMSLLALAVAFFIVEDYLLDDSASRQTPGPDAATDASTSLFVLPLRNVSPDAEQTSWVDGLTYELIGELQRQPGLRIIGPTTSFAFRGRSVPEVADEFDVQYILEGSVDWDEGRFRVRLQLSDRSGFARWPYAHEGSSASIFQAHDEIVRGIISELAPELGIETGPAGSGTDSFEAYQLYLAARALNSAQGNGPQMLGLLDEALAIDPEFAEAWSLKARTLNTTYIDKLAEAGAEDLVGAMEAAQKAIELAPDLGHGYGARAAIRETQRDWSGAASDLQHVRARGLEDALFPLTTGFIEEGHEALQSLLATDPLDSNVHYMLMVTYELLGDSQAADEVYRQGQHLFGSDWFLGNAASTWLRLGRGQVGPGYEPISESDDFSALADSIEDPKRGLAELGRLSEDPENQKPALLVTYAIWAAFFDDGDLALDLLDRALTESGSGVMTWLAWLPVFEDVRRTSEFKALMIKSGLVDYWRSNGWPDICRPSGSDFDCR